MISEKLNEFKKDQKVIEIGRRNYSEDVIICQVRSVSEFFVQLTEYNHSGEFDGINIIFIEDITDILWNSKEVESIEKLMKAVTPFEVKKINLDSTFAIIEDIKSKYNSIEIWKEGIGTGGHFGEILNFDEEWIHMFEYTHKGNTSTYECILRADQISKIATDTLYLKNLAKIYNRKNLTSCST